ncbi:phosphatase PAP2 family protein [Pseudoduganella eburnea]|uniref:Phosphatase PAP2 family protein n=1 Tax=Massilia eburnea TaxID=1776165 RepID=A0A6L6QAM7_9BURK|nr:phosphatase PAP2 family protein [Massilia eburnea]MTW09280.1 phosphatase PAP2 family protein [Massilia eburnea]
MRDTIRLPLHLVAGLALLIAAAAAFQAVASAALGPGARLAALDISVSQWLHAHASEPLTTFLLAVSWLHSVAGIAFLTALFAWHLWRKQARYWMLALLLAVPPGMLLNVLLKHSYQRARPSFDVPLLTLPTFSFPSGHTLAATVFYGVLACYLWPHARNPFQRAAVVLGAVLVVALVAFSRMYLGVHFLTDVLAAVAEGLGWLAVCVTAVSSLRRHRERL